MELTKEQTQTFKNLQKYTMEMVAAFNGLSGDDVKNVSDSFIKAVAKNSGMTVEEAQKKCWEEREFVPAGVTPSGKFMVNAGLISQKELDALMEAQAAARIITHIDVLDGKYPLDVQQGRDFFTPTQHLEVITKALVNDTCVEMEEYRKHLNETAVDHRDRYLDKDWTLAETRKDNNQNVFLLKARNNAVNVLKESAVQLNPKIAKEIVSLANALDTRKDAKVQKNEAEEFKAVKAFLDKMPEVKDKDSWAFDGYNYLMKCIENRLKAEEKSSSPLTGKDIKDLQKNTKNQIVQSEIDMIFQKDKNAFGNSNDNIGIVARLQKAKGGRG